jgi:hypothetical protein
VQHAHSNIELILSWRTAGYREVNMAVLAFLGGGWPWVLVLGLDRFLSEASCRKKYNEKDQSPPVHRAPLALIVIHGCKWILLFALLDTSRGNIRGKVLVCQQIYFRVAPRSFCFDPAFSFNERRAKTERGKDRAQNDPTGDSEER